MDNDATNSLAVPVGVTLDRHITHQQRAFPLATGDLSQLLRDVALASKIISREINRAGLTDIVGTQETTNVQGECQQTLDVVANIRFVRALSRGGEVCAILTEEEEHPVLTGNNHARYVVALDPLDGSSNIDVNGCVGTIFSIYRRVTPLGGPPDASDFLQGGRRQVAAGYVLYSASTMLVYTTGRGVFGFTYDPALGEYLLSHPAITSPAEGRVFSCNEGNWLHYSQPIRNYLTQCRQRAYSGRYVGALVGDFHRNLLKGGIYLYPSTHASPRGKLRLLYECFPLAFIAEQAGGQAIDEHGSVLDQPPAAVHQRSPLFVGSAGMINELCALMEVSAGKLAK